MSLLSIFANLFGCKPKQDATVVTTHKSDWTKVIVEGIATEWRIEDISKTKSAQKWRTYVLIQVDKWEIPDFPNKTFEVEQFRMNRPTLESDKTISAGDRLRLEVAVDKLPKPDYYTWQGTEKSEQ